MPGRSPVPPRSVVILLACALTGHLARAGPVTIRSIPDGATVCHAGEAVGMTGEAGLLLELPNRAFPFVVFKDGFEPEAISVLPRDGTDVAIRVTLEKANEPLAPPCELVDASESWVDAGKVEAGWTTGVRYLRGPGVPEDDSVQKSWDNSLTVTEDYLILGFRDAEHLPVYIPIAHIEELWYGQEIALNQEKWAAAGLVDPALELLGLLHRERKHHVMVTWTDWDGQTASIVMRLHKKAVREISNALVLYSGKPLSARPGDREWLLEQGVQLEPGS